MYAQVSTISTITKEELACICACLHIVMGKENYKITNITKQQNKWVKGAREMILNQSQMFYRWR
ncbi:hypothetical protein Calkro_1384 [Caldicellulosiruptor kronotskyensis 2002]|uniref:Uncharacterized protein n=4 Tax=Caldicellulosiruptor TaxID=44000 RepID=E4QAU8_CALH1|nr:MULTISPECIES: hypothetical protein [Caldicellulosiruptor]ADQ07126.1 conserved hypothetical protein [Caldicellulosiruptor hydrothermalis 108]ADQ40810.1 hypothetical protein Calkr_1303 [Caldicellulosiruptor acetigenus I77R1B]ADQ46240.1 hypothetical protein Calkro_1384 [Caldicellulosiruptor kronotskyensis 2002]AEM73357.1 hypothetical protein Calla_0705 [Caldicellulosiruptor acetigenus 6A]